MSKLSWIKKDGSFDLKSFVKDWIAALRSGKYKQTTEQLKDSVGYCCFGVACDRLAIRGMGRWDGDTFILSNFPTDYCAMDVELDDEALRYLRLSKAIQNTFIDLNDEVQLYDEDSLFAGRSLPFPLIADMLEEYYKSIGVL